MQNPIIKKTLILLNPWVQHPAHGPFLKHSSRRQNGLLTELRTPINILQIYIEADKFQNCKNLLLQVRVISDSDIKEHCDSCDYRQIN
jgi:hypothetical protein